MKTQIFDPMTTGPQQGVQLFDHQAYNRLLKDSFSPDFNFEPLSSRSQEETVTMRHIGANGFCYASFLTDSGDLIPMIGTEIISYAAFDGPAIIPTLWEQHEGKEPETWMSFTPMEMITQRFGIEAAKGTVMVAGCGLGWFARQCLIKPEVDYVVIVDNEPDIIREFGEPLVREFPGRCKLFCADAYDYIERHSKVYDSVLFDIWKKWGSAHLDERFQALKKLCGPEITVWGWGDLEEECIALADMMNKSPMESVESLMYRIRAYSCGSGMPRQGKAG